jgi:hypothetical protein
LTSLSLQLSTYLTLHGLVSFLMSANTSAVVSLNPILAHASGLLGSSDSFLPSTRTIAFWILMVKNYRNYQVIQKRGLR